MHTDLGRVTRGCLITLEGIDGCGKTTLSVTLARLLADLGLPIVSTREPGQTALGAHIRALVQQKTVPICPKAEYLLFATNRAQHFNELILPRLADNNIIICDRLADSSLVYQGYARGLGIDTITAINAWVMENRMPDLVIYVQVPVEVATARIQKRGGTLSSFELEKELFTRKVFEGYEALVANRDDVLVVDGQLEPVKLAQITCEKVVSFLQQQGFVQ